MRLGGCLIPFLCHRSPGILRPKADPQTGGDQIPHGFCRITFKNNFGAKICLVKITVADLPDRSGSGQADIAGISGISQPDGFLFSKRRMGRYRQIQVFFQHNHVISVFLPGRAGPYSRNADVVIRLCVGLIKLKVDVRAHSPVRDNTVGQK